MRFKTEKIKQEFTSYQSTYDAEQRKLFIYINILDDICQLCGWGEITITSYFRADPKSLHSLGLAADIRIKDKPLLMYLTLHTICKAIETVDKRLRTNFHYDMFTTENKHIHVEIRYRNV